MLESLKNKRILVVAAHPDDELLGLGGTMNRLISDCNVTARVIILGEGITSRSDIRDTEVWKKQLDIHRLNIHAAQNAIGYQSIGTYDFPDNRFDSVDLLNLIKVIEREILEFHPEVIFTHHGGDLNIDHQRTFEAVVTATRPMSHERVKTIITFETPSGTEWRASSDPKHFIPNLFFAISEENLKAKVIGMESYEFEKRTYPHPRSPKGLKILAQKRGIEIGTLYAEAFMIIRNIN